MTLGVDRGNSPAVHAIRHLLAQRHLAVLICAVVVLLKLLVPTGYMIGSEHGMVSISICSGGVARTMTVPGMGGDMAAIPDHGPSKDHGKVEIPCAYSGLSASVIGAVDPLLLGIALAVVAAVALLTAHRPALRPAPYLRPPLRGPPLSLK